MNLISRTIMPAIYQEDIVPGAGSQFRLGNTSLTMLFSPIQKETRQLLWGIGPVAPVANGNGSELGRKKWGAGPSGIAVKELGPWTIGVLVNHVWSFAGNSDRADINNRFSSHLQLQPMPGQMPGQHQYNQNVRITGRTSHGRCL